MRGKFFRKKEEKKTTIERNPMRIYGYGDQGIDDSGYGCVYRNLQSLMSLFTKSIPTIPELRGLLGIPFSRNARRMWIEPPEAEDLFRALVPHVPTKSVIMRNTQLLGLICIRIGIFTETQLISTTSFARRPFPF